MSPSTLSDEEKSSIISIFNKHINETLLVEKRFYNITFAMVKCFDFTPLPGKLNHIWNDIFYLYEWQCLGNGKHIGRDGTYVETHNRLNSFVSKKKNKNIMDLENNTRYKKVVYGAMADEEPKDYYIGRVRIITGSKFLEYMIPGENKAFEISRLLYDLMLWFNIEKIIPFLQSLSYPKRDEQVPSD